MTPADSFFVVVCLFVCLFVCCFVFVVVVVFAGKGLIM